VAIGEDGKTWLSLVNLNPSESVSLLIDAGMGVEGASGEVLTANAMDAHNTFDDPGQVVPAKYSARARNGKLVLELPARSVVVAHLN
jgi:alpha-N-arabinofuranosidase